MSREVKQYFRKDCIFHHWETHQIMGIPFLVCSKCGRSLPQAIKEKTITKQEMNKMQQKPKYPKTLEEIVEDVWEKKYGGRKR